MHRLAPFAAAALAAAPGSMPACGATPSPLSNGAAAGGAPAPTAPAASAPGAAASAPRAVVAGDGAAPRPAEGASPALAPLAAASPWAELALDGFAPAVVSLPLGARGPRPVMLIAHGAGDNPSWQCEWWRGRVGDRAFLLCPRGVPAGRLPSGNMGYAYANEGALEREALAALAALAARYGPYVDGAGAVYAGFSQGATFGVALLARHAARFRAAILIEGGSRPEVWTGARARAFAAGGLTRVLFGCGRAGCAEGARRAARRLEAAGANVRVFYAVGAGHTYAGTGVEREAYAAFDWVVEGDARWGGAASAP